MKPKKIDEKEESTYFIVERALTLFFNNIREIMILVIPFVLFIELFKLAIFLNFFPEYLGSDSYFFEDNELRILIEAIPLTFLWVFFSNYMYINLAKKSKNIKTLYLRSITHFIYAILTFCLVLFWVLLIAVLIYFVSTINSILAILLPLILFIICVVYSCIHWIFCFNCIAIHNIWGYKSLKMSECLVKGKFKYTLIFSSVLGSIFYYLEKAIFSIIILCNHFLKIRNLAFFHIIFDYFNALLSVLFVFILTSFYLNRYSLKLSILIEKGFFHSDENALECYRCGKKISKDNNHFKCKSCSKLFCNKHKSKHNEDICNKCKECSD